MPNITTLIFDLDGTLYDNPELLEKQRVVAVEVLRDFFQWDRQHILDVLRLTEKHLKKVLGCKPTTSSVIVTAGVPLVTYLYECGRRYDAGAYLKQDDALIALFRILRENFRLIIVTNNNRVQTDLILKKLGIFDLVHDIYSLYETRIIKPDMALYKLVLEECGLTPDECLVAGDRYEIDLAPAEALGMHTLLVKSMTDIYHIEDHIEKQQEQEYPQESPAT